MFFSDLKLWFIINIGEVPLQVLQQHITTTKQTDQPNTKETNLLMRQMKDAKNFKQHKY